MMVGGYIFAFIFGWFPGPLENCPLDSANSTDYEEEGVLFVDGIIPKLN